MKVGSPILIVEDNDDHYEFIRRTLRRTRYKNHSVMRAATLGEARSLLESAVPELIFVDQELPDSDSESTALEVLSKAAHQPVVIAITSLNDEELAQELLRHGVQDYILKDQLTVSVLEKTIKYAFSRKQLVGELNQKNEALEAFVRAVSHDLQAPLATILLEIGMARQDFAPASAELTTFFGGLETACFGMRRIINALLSYAKIKRSGADEMEKVSLVELVDVVKRQIGSLISERKADVSADGSCTFWGAKPALIQIFQNLASNAIIHNDRDHPKVTLSCSELENAVQIDVTDNGRGIKKDSVRDIFTPFVSSRSNPDCVGLGLAIVKRLTEMHGGSITISESSSEGTTFRLLLPLIKPEETEPHE